MWGLGVPAWIGIGCLAIAAGWLISLFARAPRGWEDKDGWHRDRREDVEADHAPGMGTAPLDEIMS